MPEAARPLQPHFMFRNGPRRQGCAHAGAKRVRSFAHAAPPLTAPGRCQDILLIVGGGAPWSAFPTVAPAGRESAATKTQPDKPRANKSGQLDVLRTPVPGVLLRARPADLLQPFRDALFNAPAGRKVVFPA